MKHENMNEYALPFAAWDLRLYLDTHPEDECALNEYRRICAATGDKCNYACHTYGARGASYTNAYDNDARGVTRDNGCACGNNDTRGVTRDNGCGCGNNDTRGVTRDNGYGCGNNGTRGVTRGNNYGGGNYGGNRGDSGNYATRRSENGGCGCEDNGGVHHRSNNVYVWSWIEGPWPWEPEANGGDC